MQTRLVKPWNRKVWQKWAQRAWLLASFDRRVGKSEQYKALKDDVRFLKERSGVAWRTCDGVVALKIAHFKRCLATELESSLSNQWHVAGHDLYVASKHPLHDTCRDAATGRHIKNTPVAFAPREEAATRDDDATTRRARCEHRSTLNGNPRTHLGQLPCKGGPPKIGFGAMVRSAALSGLECMVLSDAEYQSLHATIFKFAREVLWGAACKILADDGSKNYYAIPDTDVVKLRPDKSGTLCALLAVLAMCGPPSSLTSAIAGYRLWKTTALTLSCRCRMAGWMWVPTPGQNNWRLICSLLFGWIQLLNVCLAWAIAFFLSLHVRNGFRNILAPAFLRVVSAIPVRMIRELRMRTFPSHVSSHAMRQWWRQCLRCQ